LLGAFTKLRKQSISAVMSVRLSAHMEQICSHWTDFHKMWYLNIFYTWQENSSFITIGLTRASLAEDQYTFLSHLTHFFLECEMFWTKFVEKIKTQIFLAQ